MPNDSEMHEKRMILFSCRSRSNCRLVCEANQEGLEHSATNTVGVTLQTMSAVAVICCDASQHVHRERGSVAGECMATGQAGRSNGCAPQQGFYFPPMSFFSSFFFSSSALSLVVPFFSFCSAGAGSPAKDTAVPMPNVRNAASAMKLA